MGLCNILKDCRCIRITDIHPKSMSLIVREGLTQGNLRHFNHESKEAEKNSSAIAVKVLTVNQTSLCLRQPLGESCRFVIEAPTVLEG